MNNLVTKEKTANLIVELPKKGNDMKHGTPHLWLALLLCPRFGVRQYRQICQLLPDIETLFSIPHQDLSLYQLSPQQVAYFKAINWRQIEAEWAWIQLHKISMVTIESQHYPSLLKQIANPPLVLFVKGELDYLNQPQFAFVGSRNPSHYGIEITKKLASAMATTNALVTSGLAIGIDGIAHKACLDSGGKTIAVLGSGFRHIYPKRHLELAEQIAEQGAVVTEFLSFIPPIHYNFPRRNRIISGLSNGTLVIEAALKSGSLVTAKYAVEQNREVFAVPGNINNPLSRGPHILIQQGAKLVSELDDIIEEFVWVENSEKTQQKKNLAESKLLASVDHDTTPVDVIVQRSKLPVEQVLIELLDLEVQGLVAAVPGGYIRQA